MAMIAGADAGLGGQLGAARPRARFMLTPLVDVVFLLLIFFMLSSSIAPYALLNVAGGRAADSPAAATGAAVQPPAVMTIGRGIVRAGEIQIGIGELPQAVVALKKAGLEDVVLLTTRAATVQDLASVLEAFQAAGVAKVRLVGLPRRPADAN